MSQAKISLDLNCIAGFSLLHIGRTDDILSASLITFCTGHWIKWTLRLCKDCFSALQFNTRVELTLQSLCGAPVFQTGCT